MDWLWNTDGFPPRWSCGAGWVDEPYLGWLHILADLLTWAAYSAIPGVLAYFVLKRKDAVFPQVFWLFCAFIISCGLVHLVEAAIFWTPLYRLSAVLKVITALVSAATVVALVRVLPTALALPGLATVNSELRESKASLRTILDTSRNFIGLLSPDGVVLDANRTSLQVAGVGSEQVLGKPFAEAAWWSHSPELRSRLDEAIRRAAAGETDRFETTHATPDGPVDFEFRIQPVLAGGKVVGLVPEGEDVTERNRREAKLRENAVRLEELNGELQEFAYIASHDLRSPLRGISTLCSIIREDEVERLSADGVQRLGEVEQRVQRMDKLLDDLLAYSRAGSEAADRVDVDTGELVDELIELLVVPDGFRVERDPAMPVVHAPIAAIRLVFANLINNALKHHRGERGTIRVHGEEDGDGVTFRVRDDGQGIDPADHERIFGLFQTLHRKDEVEGSGLGLALVKKTVERIGGTIRVESAVGEGATFVVRLPKRTAASERS